MTAENFSQSRRQQPSGTVDDEIARLALVCDISILDPGIIERIVANDASVCDKPNDGAFRKLRGLVSLHYALTDDNLNALGADESERILQGIRERLRDVANRVTNPGKN